MKNIKNGFTLVELIIVIAVIGVLAAILIPTFANVIDKANNKSAFSDAKNALEIYIADSTDHTGGLTIGEGSVFKVRKASKDLYYTYYENSLHEGTGATNADPERVIPVPANSVKIMASDSYYIAEKDADTQIYDNLPSTVIIYNTDSDSYTPPVEDLEMDGEFILISKAAQLSNEFFTQNGLNNKYKLKNNITLSGDFIPISGEFSGELNGNGKTISGLNINMPNGDGVGLFEMVNGGNLYNFTLGVNSILGEFHVGSVCGSSNNARFTNIHVNIQNEIKAVHFIEDVDEDVWESSVGGFSSSGVNVTISRCSVKGKVCVVGNTRGFFVGGMFRHMSGTMSECYFIGTVEGSDTDGCTASGLAGDLYGVTISNCYAKVNFVNVGLTCGIGGTSINDVTNRIENCVVVCTGLDFCEQLGSGRGAAFAIDYCNSCQLVGCYVLTDNPLTQYPFTGLGGHNESENGTLVASLTEDTCVALNNYGVDNIWTFEGEYPTLVNNPE